MRARKTGTCPGLWSTGATIFTSAPLIFAEVPSKPCHCRAMGRCPTGGSPRPTAVLPSCTWSACTCGSPCWSKVQLCLSSERPHVPLSVFCHSGGAPGLPCSVLAPLPPATAAGKGGAHIRLCGGFPAEYPVALDMEGKPFSSGNKCAPM